MMHKAQHEQAEAFIDQVIAPIRAAEAAKFKDLRARAALEREERELVRRDLADSGIDVKRLDKLAETRSKLRQKLTDEERRQAVEQSEAAGGRFPGLGGFVFPADPTEIILDQVTFVRSFADQGSVYDSNVAPFDNWARYRMTSGSLWDGIGRLSFFTLWQNPLDANSSISPRVSFAINAHLSCEADWSGVASWFGLSSQAHAKVHVRTTVWGMNSSVSSVVNDLEIGSASVDGGFFGDESSQSISFNGELEASVVVVPPNEYVLIEVEVVTDWHANGDAKVVLDAESGSRRVFVSQIVLGGTMQQPPTPITLSATVSPPPGGGVTLTWSGAAGARVDIYQNGMKIGDTENDGSWTMSLSPGTYIFRICETGSTHCSNDISVTV